MENAELINGLRWCADESICCDDFSGEKCPYFDENKDSYSTDEILHTAADALEADEQRIAELEKQVVAYQKLTKRCGKQMCKLETENKNLQDKVREKVIMLQRAKEGYVDAEN